MDNSNKGQLIVVKYVNGSLLVRRLWSVAERGVYILSESEWKKRSEGKHSLAPVGFPMEDVFLYPDDYTAVITEDWKLNNLHIDSLTPFPHEICS
jgi:hypothetical protein